MANDNNKENSLLNTILEYGGAIIIFGIVILFLVLATAKSCERDENKVYVDTLHVAKIDFFEISKKKSDTNFIVIDKNIVDNLKITTDSINTKIVQLNKASNEINLIQKENSESLRFYLTILGSIFAIVGFFGFKSIHDTRQTAIDSVKIKAEEVAKKTTEEKMQEYIDKNVKTNIDNYLEKEGNQIIKEHSEKISKTIAYDHAESIAKATTLEEFNKLRNNYDEAKRALRDDLENIERDRKSLLKRIQDLEKFFYGDPEEEENDDDETPTNDENDNLAV